MKDKYNLLMTEIIISVLFLTIGMSISGILYASSLNVSKSNNDRINAMNEIKSVVAVLQEKDFDSAAGIIGGTIHEDIITVNYSENWIPTENSKTKYVLMTEKNGEEYTITVFDREGEEIISQKVYIHTTITLMTSETLYEE
ncbi:MAG: hypothetical protein PUB11_04595 [Oscillospiraceae bacterium]|nr:hypothetical protein [Oscillospiraceae bacterium]